MLSNSVSSTLRRVVSGRHPFLGWTQRRDLSYLHRPVRVSSISKAQLPFSTAALSQLREWRYLHGGLSQQRCYCLPEDLSEKGSYDELSVQELSKILQSPTSVNAYQFVDVREPWEVDKASLPFFKTFPLGNLLNGLEDDLDDDKPTVLLCHHGVRSKRAAFYLLDRGFGHVINVTGGIDAYSRTVDASVPLY